MRQNYHYVYIKNFCPGSHAGTVLEPQHQAGTGEREGIQGTLTLHTNCQ